MKQFYGAVALGAALIGSALAGPAIAAPPTVVPSPGYDARLQEQRAALQRAESAKPVYIRAAAEAETASQRAALTAVASLGRMKIWIAAVGLVLGFRCPRLPAITPARSAPIAGRMDCRRCGPTASSTRWRCSRRKRWPRAAPSATPPRAVFRRAWRALRKSRAAENIAAGFLSFAETLKQWKNQRRASRKPADAGRQKGRRGFGRQRGLALPDVLGDGDH